MRINFYPGWINMWKMVLFAVLLPLKLQAAELKGVKFEDKVQVEGKELVLNGLGLRLATFLKIKVYVAGLYLENKSTDENAVIGSGGIKFLRMHFLRDVDKEDLVEGFKKGFEKNKFDTTSLKVELNKFYNFLGDSKEGKEMSFQIANGKLLVTQEDKKLEINNPALSAKFLLLWIGSPPNDELKSGLLGGSF
ncbi:MAG: chalcone isomerase family protein [Halobacteriovoraceae bacterium]|nr:chalcone isomerase family protein [Halobacteriovoraceae bacterium]